MTIDDAIAALKQAKKEGQKAGVFAWWFASDFDRQDDELWLSDTEHVEDVMDWSATHEQIEYVIDEFIAFNRKTDEGAHDE